MTTSLLEFRELRVGAPRRRHFVGGLFLVTAGVHVGIVMADTDYYRSFADDALPWVHSAWQDVFLAAPTVWGLLVAAGELSLGLLLLGNRTASRLGWLGVIGFHVALTLFGWGFLFWTVPALAFLIPAARRDWRRLE